MIEAGKQYRFKPKGCLDPLVKAHRDQIVTTIGLHPAGTDTCWEIKAGDGWIGFAYPDELQPVVQGSHGIWQWLV